MDLGCGEGIIGECIQQLGFKVIGCDKSYNAIKNAKIKVILCDLEEKIPVENSSFDIVLAAEIIEHILDTDKFIEEIHRVLKPRGKLVITTPNLASLECRISLLLGKKPWMIENRVLPHSAGHVRYFTVKEIRKLLEDHNFEVKLITTNFIKLKNVVFERISKLFPQLGHSIIVVAERK